MGLIMQKFYYGKFLEQAERAVRLPCKSDPKWRREGEQIGWKHPRLPCSQRKVWQSHMESPSQSQWSEKSHVSQKQVCLSILPHSVIDGPAHGRHGLSTNAVMDFTIQQLKPWSVTLPGWRSPKSHSHGYHREIIMKIYFVMHIYMGSNLLYFFLIII